MKVYIVEREIIHDDHWIEATFDSRQKANEYCIKSGCSQRMDDGIDTDWQNPKNPLEQCYVIESEIR